MEAALDFVSRSRHAWQEFRQPSDMQTFQQVAAAHVAPDDGRRGSAHEGRSQGMHGMPQPLDEFRLLVGINQDKSFGALHGFRGNRRAVTSLDNRPAPNMGIYGRVCDAEIKCKRNFKGASRLINFCLGAQIVVAAALTALGASGSASQAVTAFGAINTVIAGFLTYLKGSGLPNRIKYFQHEWAKIREYIEQVERDLMCGRPGMDVNEEISRIREMFEMVRTDVETNTPDRFVSVNSLRPGAYGKKGGDNVARPQASFSTTGSLPKWNEKEAEAQAQAQAATVSKVQGAVSTASHLFSSLGHIKETLEDKAHEVGKMEKEIESHGRQAVEEKKTGFFDQIKAVGNEVAHMGQEMQSKAKGAVAETVAEKERQGQAAISQSADAARAGLAQQREVLNRALTDEKDHPTHPSNM